MDRKFQCSCNSIVFVTTGYKKEYISKMFGPCEKYVAICPDCGAEVDERIELKANKDSKANTSGCSAGCCGCKHAH